MQIGWLSPIVLAREKWRSLGDLLLPRRDKKEVKVTTFAPKPLTRALAGEAKELAKQI
jgi:hypothetical protein